MPKEKSRKKKKGELFGGLSTTKIMAIFAIIVACFATLYPRFFHPLLFGSGESSKPKENYDPYDDLPPSARARMGGAGMDRDRGGGSPRGPHPGMRYSGGSEGAKKESGGGGRGGMVSTILPVYAVGIVCYLVYTLFKVFGARKKDKNRRKFGRRLTENSSEDEQAGNTTEENEEDKDEDKDEDDKSDKEDSEKESDKNKSDSDKSDHDSESEPEEEVKAKKKRPVEKKVKSKSNKSTANELEELLLRADEGDMSVEELHALQKRLADTENQLSRILKTMRNLDTKTASLAKKERKLEPQEEGSDEENENSGDVTADVAAKPAVEPVPEKVESEEESKKTEGSKGDKVRRRKGGKQHKQEKSSEQENQSGRSKKAVAAGGAKDE